MLTPEDRLIRSLERSVDCFEKADKDKELGYDVTAAILVLNAYSHMREALTVARDWDIDWPLFHKKMNRKD